MIDYIERKMKWDRQIRNILIEVLKERDKNDLLFTLNIIPIKKAFTDVLKQIDIAKGLTKHDD